MSPHPSLLCPNVLFDLLWRRQHAEQMSSSSCPPRPSGLSPRGHSSFGAQQRVRAARAAPSRAPNLTFDSGDCAYPCAPPSLQLCHLLHGAASHRRCRAGSRCLCTTNSLSTSFLQVSNKNSHDTDTWSRVASTYSLKKLRMLDSCCKPGQAFSPCETCSLDTAGWFCHTYHFAHVAFKRPPHL